MARPAARWIGLVLVAAVVWTWWRLRRLTDPSGPAPSTTDRTPGLTTAPDLTTAPVPVGPVGDSVPASAGRPLRSVPDVADPDPSPEPVAGSAPAPDPAPVAEPEPSAERAADPAPVAEPLAAPESPPVDGGGQRWVEPVDGACPDGYPIKVNERSGIYHVPGGLSYDRTSPTRCYPDEAAATADGFRRAKR